MRRFRTIGFRGIYPPDSGGAENIKSPKSQQYQGFLGIDAKTALQIGGLFLYQSLRFDLVEVTGLEPAASCSQSKRATNCATPRHMHVCYILSSEWFFVKSNLKNRATKLFL